MKFFILIVALGAARATLYDQKLDAASTYDCPYCQPEQVHIAFGEKSNDIVVTWSTFNDTEGSFVQYGVGDEAERGHFDLILHVGDFAYDMHDDDGKRGDQFMRQIQPLAAMVPYMTCPGNHEAT
ncbi:hypothetical protein MSG28_004852 [Choristoneura fumiferana]|nr:hypothetical protein MSG28_004852 [Choristoneura fumiferana]